MQSILNKVKEIYNNWQVERNETIIKRTAEQVKRLEESNIAMETEQFNRRATFFSDLIDIASDFTYVKFDGTNLSVTHDDYLSANLALKELRVLKKKTLVKKREITTEYKEIRDEYSQKVGNRSTMPLLTGTGKFGTLVRAGVRAQRASERANMANIKQSKEKAVAPWDEMSDVLDRTIIKVESAKIKYEVGDQ
jgi:hypothetical protein